MVRSPSRKTPKFRASRRSPIPTHKGLRKNTGRTSLPTKLLAPCYILSFKCPCEHLSEKPSQETFRSMSCVCRSMRAIPMPELGTTQSGHFGSTAHTPASLKGLLTRRIFILSD